MSKREKSTCISTSADLQKLLTPARIHGIIEEMNSQDWWRDEVDWTNGILFCLSHISYYLESGPQNVIENYGWFFLIGSYIFFYYISSTSNSENRRLIAAHSLQVSTEKLTEEEHNEASSLMRRYQCFSCPICLEDYKEVASNSFNDIDEDGLETHLTNTKYESNSDGDRTEAQSSIDYGSISRVQYEGCDGSPINLLRCGHSTCQKCWDEWNSIAKNTNLCPVCKRHIRKL